jgi:hypothetical protein
MPFDAATPVRLGLNDRLAAYGIEPVSMEFLERHKAEQVRLAPASFLMTWKPLVIVGAMAVTGGIWLGGVVPILSFLALGWVGMILARVFAGPIRGRPLVRQGRWVQYWNVPAFSAPAPIAQIARDLKDRHPDGMLILGKLLQEDVVLDPYLLFLLDGERVCLGIWDTHGVIASASYV